MVEIIELLKTLVKDKAQAADQQNNTVQLEHRREDPAYPHGFTPPYTQAQLMPQMGGFPYGYAPPRHKHTKWGRTLGQTRLTQ